MKQRRSYYNSAMLSFSVLNIHQYQPDTKRKIICITYILLHEQLAVLKVESIASSVLSPLRYQILPAMGLNQSRYLLLTRHQIFLVVFLKNIERKVVSLLHIDLLENSLLMQNQRKETSTLPAQNGGTPLSNM